MVDPRVHHILDMMVFRPEYPHSLKNPESQRCDFSEMLVFRPEYSHIKSAIRIALLIWRYSGWNTNISEKSRKSTLRFSEMLVFRPEYLGIHNYLIYSFRFSIVEFLFGDFCGYIFNYFIKNIRNIFNI